MRRAVESLGGRYVTAEDVGCSVDDMRYVREETEFVSGLPQQGADAGGDPSPWTALGCFQGIKAAAQARLGTDSLDGIRVAVQGVGHVGIHLCRLLGALRSFVDRLLSQIRIRSDPGVPTRE